MTQIDIEKLAKLSGLMVNLNDTKLSKSINDIMDYMSIMDSFDSQINSDKLDNTTNLPAGRQGIYNQSDRNSGTQNFSAKQEILANSHHKKINNSVVLEFKK